MLPFFIGVDPLRDPRHAAWIPRDPRHAVARPPPRGGRVTVFPCGGRLANCEHLSRGPSPSSSLPRVRCTGFPASFLCSHLTPYPPVAVESQDSTPTRFLRRCRVLHVHEPATRALHPQSWHEASRAAGPRPIRLHVCTRLLPRFSLRSVQIQPSATALRALHRPSTLPCQRPSFGPRFPSVVGLRIPPGCSGVSTSFEFPMHSSILAFVAKAVFCFFPTRVGMH